MGAEIRRILSEIRPEADFESSENFMSDGLLDSYDMIELVSELERVFEIVVDGVEIVPENFQNIGSIVSLIERSAAQS